MQRDRGDLLRAGLCARCQHVRVLGNERGSEFFQCRRGLEDASFRKYPTLPVWQCGGYESQYATLDPSAQPA